MCAIYIETKRKDKSQTIYTMIADYDLDDDQNGFLHPVKFADAVKSILNIDSCELVDIEFLGMEYEVRDKGVHY